MLFKLHFEKGQVYTKSWCNFVKGISSLGFMGAFFTFPEHTVKASIISSLLLFLWGLPDQITLKIKIQIFYLCSVWHRRDI